MLYGVVMREHLQQDKSDGDQRGQPPFCLPYQECASQLAVYHTMCNAMHMPECIREHKHSVKQACSWALKARVPN